MEKLSLADSAFLLFESDDNPMHVGALQIFELPEGGSESFCRRLYNRMRKNSSTSYPFNQREQAATHQQPGGIQCAGSPGCALPGQCQTARTVSGQYHSAQQSTEHHSVQL